MKKLWALFQHRIVWTSGAALLAIVAVPAIVILVLKALGLVHSASLHTWLLDVGLGVDADAAAAAAAAAAAGGAGSQYGPPNPYQGFLFLTPTGIYSVTYSDPSTNSPVNRHPPAGVRTTYNNVLFGPNGNPAWYHCFGASANGWVEASQTSTQRPADIRTYTLTQPVEGELYRQPVVQRPGPAVDQASANFVLAAIAAVGSDFYAVRQLLSLSPQLKLPELRFPEIGFEVKRLEALWAFLVDRRAFAYIVFRYKRSSGLVRAELACLAAILDQHLAFRHSDQAANFTQPALILPIRQGYWSG